MRVDKLLRDAITRAVEDLGLIDLEFVVEHPADEKFGDYASNVAMMATSIKVGPSQRKSPTFKQPRQAAEELKQLLEQDSELMEMVDRMEIAGPGFINFWLKKEFLVAELEAISKEGSGYGTGDWGKGKLYEVEHTSPNPNKAMHLGHLRNNLTGMALSNLFEAGGVKVIRDAVDNNRGIAIAKLMWGYLKFGKKEGQTEDIDYWYAHQDEWQTPEDLRVRPDIFVDELYVKGSEDFKDEKAEKIVRKMVSDWENEDKVTWALWKKVLDYSYQGQELTLKRLGNRWDRVWREHEHYKEGKVWVEKGLRGGVFRQLDDGAILTDLSKYNLTDTIVQKSDGTALYITQDLALTDLKKKTYQAERMFWVIGPEQSLDLKQMFAVCEQLGIGKVEEFTHVPYGYMSIKGQGKMSSRLGNVVYIDQLIDLVKKRVSEVMKERKIEDAEKELLAEKLAMGAVKYAILKIGRMTDMAFDIDNSVSFDGDSGPYLNYVYVRAKRVLEKAGVIPAEAGNYINRSPIGSGMTTEEEVAILRWMYRFPEVVEVAGRDLSPNLICSYLMELSVRFNAFYNNCPILEAGEKLEFRLGLTAAVAQVLENGLKLLGIEPVEKM